MSLQAYYEEFRRAFWADRDPKVCACHGTGYALSDVDTWHECPIHYVKGQRHPEDDRPDYSEEEYRAAQEDADREADRLAAEWSADALAHEARAEEELGRWEMDDCPF